MLERKVLVKRLVVGLLVVFMVCPLFVGLVRAAFYNAVNDGGFEYGYLEWQDGTPGDWYEQSLVESHGGERSAMDSSLDGILGNTFKQGFDELFNSSQLETLDFWYYGHGSIVITLEFNETGDQVIDFGTLDVAEWTNYNTDLDVLFNSTTDFVESIEVAITTVGGADKIYIDDISLMYADFVYDDDDWSPVDGGDTDALINTLISYLVALSILLIPSFMLGVWLNGGKWGFLIGMVIGSGLGYLLLPSVVPLWLVFLVLIGVVGMAYQSISSG